MAAAERYDWARLTHLQVGRYGEYYAKMEFTLYGFDVYGAEVDDRGDIPDTPDRRNQAVSA
jgi:hypothetical protein